MVIGTRVDAGIREPCEVDPCSPDQADKSGGYRDDSCKIILFDAPICWLRTIHRHTASETFHYPTNMSPMICQANSRRVPIDRKLGPHQQRQCLPQPPQGMAAPLPWRRDEEPAQLP